MPGTLEHEEDARSHLLANRIQKKDEPVQTGISKLFLIWQWPACP
jgi:hypothetical protein